MKKIISLLVVIVMIATLATTAFAAKAGETVTVEFEIVGNPEGGFGAYGAVINYPEEVLELVEVKAGDIKVEGALFFANGNKVTYAYPTAGAEGDGVLFVATFKVAEDAKAGEYEVTATLDTKSTTDIYQNPVAFAIKGATVVVEGEHVHAYTETIKEPTCTEDGAKIYTCECGDTYSEVIPALGHLFGKWFGVDDYYHAHTCERCECKEKEAHEWDETGLKCVICGYEKDPTLDPVPGTGDITPVVVTSAFALVALVALAGYMLKRKFAL